jgi:heterodisulfide reductase subunit A2
VSDSGSPKGGSRPDVSDSGSPKGGSRPDVSDSGSPKGGSRPDVSRVLVIGGGIAGVQATLDLASAGAQVTLVERSPSLGGKMAALDKNFPTLDCSICIEAPLLSEVNDHPNVEVLTNAEVVRLDGEAGRFAARIRQSAGFVTDECTRCDDCVPACPVVLPNEFDAGMAPRRAIYTPFQQAVPGPYVIDVDSCLNELPNVIACSRCLDACGPACIDFLQPRERSVEREVAAVLVATGFDLMDPTPLSEFGYGTHPDILTSLEFERLLNSAGPTGGEVIRPSDGRHVDSVLFVLCVGSRDSRHFEYCSRFCCMYSTKHAYQAIDHGIADVTVLYMDIRAYGKGFDAFCDRTREAGATFVRARPSSITAGTDGRLHVRYEDTEQRRIVAQTADLVVLAAAATPPRGIGPLAATLGIALDADGFLLADETAAGLVATSRAGVYMAGCASGPKDIPDSVAEASAASALALTHLTAHTWAEEEVGEPLPPSDEVRTGVFVCHCGTNIGGVIDVPRVVEYARTLSTVVHSEAALFSCSAATQSVIVDTIRERTINRVVVAACSPKTHEAIFRRVCLKAGVNPYLLEMVNLRNQDSWVHKGAPDEATRKARDLLRMGVEKARLLEPLETSLQPMVPRTLVVGGGITGLVAATNLAEQGHDTHLVERSESLGGVLRELDQLFPSGVPAHELVDATVRRAESAGVQLHVGTEIDVIGGHIGNFTARLSSGEELRAGAVIMATGARPHTPTGWGYGDDPRVTTNLDLERAGPERLSSAERVTFVGCVGSRTGRDGDPDGAAPAGCSRYCCEAMIGQALALRRQGKHVRVLYRDIRTFSRHAEELYADAAREGVLFFRYDPDSAPDDAVRYADGVVSVHDQLLGQPVQIPTDLLVLVTGLGPQAERVSEQLKIAKSQDGFLLERHPKLGPVEAGSPGIFLAGTAQAPKGVRESVAQGLAAATKAAGLLAREVIEKEPLTAKLDEEACIVCGICVRACPFGAIELVGKVKEGSMAFVSAACQGCGACAAVCNYDAIVMPYFTNEQINAQIDAALAEDPEQKVLVFACNWCSYAGADQAGIEKVQYPTSSRVIRTMCSARISPDFIARAFECGAGAVLMTGCRLTEQGSDCHYIDANQQTLKRFNFLRRKLAKRGIDSERFQLQWISAAEGKEFAAKLREMHEVVQHHCAAMEV